MIDRKWLLTVAALVFGAVGPAPAVAQQVIATYDTRISHQDLVNSRGERIGSFCGVVQQDRANFHRFNKRDPVDMGDPVFADANLRAQIATSCEIAAGYEYLPDAVLSTPASSYGYILRVTVLNDGGRLRVLVAERAG